jgi:NAD(P)H-quinone oxidoreductase subunit 5
MNNNESTYFLSKTKYPIAKNGRKMTRPFMTIAHFKHKAVSSYPYESDNTMLFPIFVLGLFTLFVGAIGIPFNQEGVNLDILSKWLAPSINLLHPKSNNSLDWNEFLKDAVVSVSIAYFGIFIASFLYKPIYSSLKNLEFINSFVKKGPKRILWDKILNGIYDWSYNRAYIDAFYTRFFVGGIRGLAEFTHFVDRRVIDGMTNGVGVISFIVGEGIKYIGGGRISSYLFLYLAYVSVFLLVYYLLF